MDTIEAKLVNSEYSRSEHLAIVVNGEALDLMLDRVYPEGDYKGLVPTLLHWLGDPDERRVVWSRILPENHQSSIAPVLMCPDDVDLWCTVIVAEVHRVDDKVMWRQLGRAAGSSDGMPDSIGRDVEWLSGLSFVFDADEYRGCISAFGERAEVR